MVDPDPFLLQILRNVMSRADAQFGEATALAARLNMDLHRELSDWKIDISTGVVSRPQRFTMTPMAQDAPCVYTSEWEDA